MATLPTAARWGLAIALVLAVPIIPFVGFGESLEAQVEQWCNAPHDPLATAGVVVGLLASDVLLPIPSSFVSTLAGSRLGPLWGTVAVWLGMSAGAMVGFALARLFGRPLAVRFSSPADLSRIEAFGVRYAPAALALTRALPVLAEASVLLCGAMGLAWRRFLPVVLLANLGLAVAYAALGHFARVQGNLAVALAASVAIPLLATMIARHWFGVSGRAT